MCGPSAPRALLPLARDCHLEERDREEGAYRQGNQEGDEQQCIRASPLLTFGLDPLNFERLLGLDQARRGKEVAVINAACRRAEQGRTDSRLGNGSMEAATGEASGGPDNPRVHRAGFRKLDSNDLADA